MWWLDRLWCLWALHDLNMTFLCILEFSLKLFVFSFPFTLIVLSFSFSRFVFISPSTSFGFPFFLWHYFLNRNLFPFLILLTHFRMDMSILVFPLQLILLWLMALHFFTCKSCSFLCTIWRFVGLSLVLFVIFLDKQLPFSWLVN